MDMVAQLKLLSEVRLSRAGIEKIIGIVLASDVAEPKLSLRINCQPRGVDGLEPGLSFQHPVDAGVGPTIWRVTVDAKWGTLLN